eukprot:5153726-Pleurochrysis_carterae.AAC.4
MSHRLSGLFSSAGSSHPPFLLLRNDPAGSGAGPRIPQHRLLGCVAAAPIHRELPQVETMQKRE